MNKLFSKIAALTLGLGLAVGVGVAAGRGVQKAEATTVSGKVYELSPTGGLPDGWTTNESGEGTAYLKLKNDEYATFDELIPEGYALTSVVNVNVSAGTFGGTSNTFNIKVELLSADESSVLATYTTTTKVADASESTYRLGNNGQDLDAGDNKASVKKLRVTVVDLASGKVSRVKNVKLTYTYVSTSSDYVATITPTNTSLTLNAGTIITKEVIGTVASTGSSPSDNYQNYTAELGTYADSTFTKAYNVNFGTSYVTYNATYNAIRLTAADYPTVAQGEEYATAIINLSINDIASSTFDIALSSASTTPITTRNVTAGAVDTLKVINVTAGTNPNVVWSSNNEEVATVDEDGNVTTIDEGEATITATSTVNNVNGVKTTASVVYTVAAGTTYSLYFNGTNTGFGNITAKTIEAVETKYYTNELAGLEWTLKTVSTETANVRVTQASVSSTFIQVGTTDNPATEFSLRSNVFGSAKTKITSVIVKTYGAAATSEATLSVAADEGTFTVGGESSVKFTGNTAKVYEFTSTGAYGHVTINFAEVSKGIKVEYILINAAKDESNKGLAYAFASKLESVDSCSSDGKAALIAEYKALSLEVKAIADAITLYDKPESEETYKTLSITVAEKMNYIIARYDTDEANVLVKNSIGSNNYSAIIFIIGAIVVTSIVGGVIYMTRKKTNR